ncbi:hypothetical protein R1sor_000250 [Riccia sorocarpa]|uniref:F-box domain-containing protein n=1 Tax=Riccia sorocarpa TaxID=122646 RepID=A0ABD3GST4_9MARC
MRSLSFTAEKSSQIIREFLEVIDRDCDPRGRLVETDTSTSTLLPPLHDCLVICEIFPRLPQTPSMLWRLRRVPMSWQSLVSQSMSWQGLEVVRVNHRDFRRCVSSGELAFVSLVDRLGREVAILTLLSELGESQINFRGGRSRLQRGGRRRDFRGDRRVIRATATKNATIVMFHGGRPVFAAPRRNIMVVDPSVAAKTRRSPQIRDDRGAGITWYAASA